ncbi:hypothetical protein J5N97_026209 [Dioscorea zingiberensis]|uniref:Uncharacterized protein n=1 Tax=Dioscorea zingiberensis TaxID=325984 RepID=A0A9D5H6H7_9LILI|nr:hypothetical protein J5N97_026209 [Dioscorea zingiberensis]
MGRGRGKGKKLTVATSHEDPGSGGEEALHAYKRRGRPQKLLKDDIDEEENEKIEEEEEVEGDDIKLTISSKETKGTVVDNGRKRKRQLVKQSSDSALDENGAGTKSGNGDTAKPNGFRQNGSRRKSKPRRAAEAVVECNVMLVPIGIIDLLFTKPKGLEFMCVLEVPP